VIAAWYGALIMSQFKWFICPRTDLSIWQPMPCAEVPETFRPHTFRLADLLVRGCCIPCMVMPARLRTGRCISVCVALPWLLHSTYVWASSSYQQTSYL